MEHVCVSENFGYRKTLWIREEGLFHVFVSKFLSHCTKIFVENTSVFQKTSGIKNIMDKRRGGCITIFCQSFGLTKPKNFVGNPSGFQKKIESRKILCKKGISFFCAINFLPRRVQKFRRGTGLCFRKIRVSKVSMDKRRGVCITIFCQSFCLTVPKSIVGEPLCVSEKNRVSKILWIREEGSVSRFFVKVCVSQNRKFSWGTLLDFRKKSSLEKFYAKKGYLFLCH